nr:cytochrome p450 3a12 [Quercus suber]
MEFYDLFSAATMDIVSAYVFGAKNSSNLLQDPMLGQKFFRDYKARQLYQFWPQDAPKTTAILAFLGLKWLVVPPWINKANADIEAWLLAMCDKAEQTSHEHDEQNAQQANPEDRPTVYLQTRTAMARALTSASDSKSAESQFRLTIASELLDHVLAGFDTSSITLAFLAWELSQPHNSSWQTRLHAELLTLPTSAPLDAKALDALPILHAIIMESLRLHAAIPGNQPRVSPPDASLAHLTHLPAGLRVQSQAWSLHRNATVFPDPEAWRPERWLDASATQKREMARWCVGSHLAMHDMKAVVAVVWRAFRTRLVDGAGMRHSGGYEAGPRGHDGRCECHTFSVSCSLAVSCLLPAPKRETRSSSSFLLKQSVPPICPPSRGPLGHFCSAPVRVSSLLVARARATQQQAPRAAFLPQPALPARRRQEAAATVVVLGRGDARRRCGVGLRVRGDVATAGRRLLRGWRRRGVGLGIRGRRRGAGGFAAGGGVGRGGGGGADVLGQGVVVGEEVGLPAGLRVVMVVGWGRIALLLLAVAGGAVHEDGGGGVAAGAAGGFGAEAAGAAEGVGGRGDEGRAGVGEGDGRDGDAVGFAEEAVAAEEAGADALDRVAVVPARFARGARDRVDGRGEREGDAVGALRGGGGGGGGAGVFVLVVVSDGRRPAFLERHPDARRGDELAEQVVRLVLVERGAFVLVHGVGQDGRGLLGGGEGSGDRGVRHLVSIVDLQAGLGEAGDDGMPAAVGRDGAEVEALVLGLAGLFVPLRHPPHRQSQAVVIHAVELIAAVGQLARVPLHPRHQTDPRPAARAALLLLALADQPDHVPHVLLIVVVVLGRVVAGMHDHQVVGTQAMPGLEESGDDAREPDGEVGGVDDIEGGSGTGVGGEQMQLQDGSRATMETLPGGRGGRGMAHAEARLGLVVALGGAASTAPGTRARLAVPAAVRLGEHDGARASTKGGRTGGGAIDRARSFLVGRIRGGRSGVRSVVVVGREGIQHVDDAGGEGRGPSREGSGCHGVRRAMDD